MPSIGSADLDELKIEFEDLILVDAPIEVSGFAPWTRSTDREPEAVEHGPLAPDPGGVAIARRCDMFHSSGLAA